MEEYGINEFEKLVLELCENYKEAANCFSNLNTSRICDSNMLFSVWMTASMKFLMVTIDFVGSQAPNLKEKLKLVKMVENTLKLYLDDIRENLLKKNK